MLAVAARLFGGLGNQMFIYAAARRLALVSGARLLLDTVSGFANDTRYRRQFALGGCHLPVQVLTDINTVRPPSGAERRAYRLLNRWLPFTSRSWIYESNHRFEPRLLNLRVQRHVWLEGYWQDARYFADCADLIRAELAPRPAADPQSLEYLRLIHSSDSIAVHLRLNDPPSHGVSADGLTRYYREALQRALAAAPRSQPIVFSDDPTSAKRFMADIGHHATTVQRANPDAWQLADMWLMTQCRVLVLAPSTFSWWAGWLAPHPDKMVIAPALATGWGFERLIPSDWQAIPMK